MWRWHHCPQLPFQSTQFRSNQSDAPLHSSHLWSCLTRGSHSYLPCAACLTFVQIGLRIKSGKGRGAYVRDITYENMEIENCNIAIWSAPPQAQLHS